MLQTRTLLPDARALVCEDAQWNGESIVLSVTSANDRTACPSCGALSTRVHSRYCRKLADLPWQGKAVIVHWQNRRFFCDNSQCERRIFAERLPSVAASHARKTDRLIVAQRAIALACGGEGGSRLSVRLGMAASPDTMLRLIRRLPAKQILPGRLQVVGVDDWAMRKGHRYGTILVDLERHEPVDLLPDRSSAVLQEWLARHPQIRVVSRDRGDSYIKGCQDGAPQAVQVADRWHLLNNLQEVLVHFVERHARELQAVVRLAKTQHADALGIGDSMENWCSLRPSSSSRAEGLAQQRRAHRLELYQRVMDLYNAQTPLRAIARQLGLSRATVRKWTRAGSFPERTTPRRGSCVDHWIAYLRQRWGEGCRNAVQLFGELCRQGFTGSCQTVRRYVASWRRSDLAERPPPLRRLSAKSMAWLLFKPVAALTDKCQALVEAFRGLCPQAIVAGRLIERFREILRERKAERLDAWLDEASSAASPREFQRYANSLRGDLAAVQAACELPWSNGQTEGQVNRLKLIKRQMYVRQDSGPSKGDLEWRRPSLTTIRNLLTHPMYAGRLWTDVPESDDASNSRCSPAPATARMASPAQGSIPGLHHLARLRA